MNAHHAITFQFRPDDGTDVLDPFGHRMFLPFGVCGGQTGAKAGRVARRQPRQPHGLADVDGLRRTTRRVLRAWPRRRHPLRRLRGRRRLSARVRCKKRGRPTRLGRPSSRLRASAAGRPSSNLSVGGLHPNPRRSDGRAVHRSASRGRESGGGAWPPHQRRSVQMNRALGKCTSSTRPRWTPRRVGGDRSWPRLSTLPDWEVHR